MNGFIKIHRKITEWGWYKDTNTKAVFLHLLLTANYREREYMGYKILPGQTIIGRKELAETLGLSERAVRTALKHLKMTNEVTIKTTNRFSIVTVVNWERYQLRECEVTNEVTNKRPASDQQVTTPKERKESKEIKKRKRKEKREARLQEIEAEDQREIERLNRIARNTFRKGESR